MDLLEPRFQGQACIANPLFGTTSMHAAALFEVLGAERARGFFERFVDSGVDYMKLADRLEQLSIVSLATPRIS